MPVVAPRRKKKRSGSAKRILAIKDRLGLTYLALADKFGVSVDTVRAWAYDKRTPSGSALTILSFLEKGQI